MSCPQISGILGSGQAAAEGGAVRNEEHSRLQKFVEQQLSACERRGWGISCCLPHVLPGDFQAWTHRKPWEGRLQRSAGAERGGNAIYPHPGDAEGWDPHGSLPSGPTGQSPVPPRLPLFAGCGLQRLGQSRSRRMARSVQPQPGSGPSRSPAYPLSLFSQEPGRWRASWSSFGWAPRWPRPSSSPNTTRISAGHRALPLRSFTLFPAPQSHLRPDREETPGPTEDAPTLLPAQIPSRNPSPSASKTWEGFLFPFKGNIPRGALGRTASPSCPLALFLA